jgi:WD40 repeat protein
MSDTDAAHTRQNVGVLDHTGKKLASGGGYGDKSVRLWSTEIVAPIGSPLTGDSGISSVIFSPNSNILAVGDYGGKNRLHDPATGEVKSTLDGHT